MFGPIRCVTITCPDPAASAALYTDTLDYTPVEAPGFIPADLAASWGAPAEAGQKQILLQPASGEPVFIRLLARDDGSEPYAPLKTWGWNAAELIVRDVDALAQRLADSPWRIIGPPADLSFTDAIRAMQVEGPAGDVLYLTQFKRRLPEFDTPEPRCDVCRTFIVILGGGDLEALKRFYGRHFGVPDAPVIEAEVSVLSNANGLPPQTMHRICAMPLDGQSFIEADAFPAGTGPRARSADRLAPGIAMVSFEVDDLARVAPEVETLAARCAQPPYFGARTVTVYGPAGEAIELIERPAAT